MTFLIILKNEKEKKGLRDKLTTKRVRKGLYVENKTDF